MAFRRRSWKRKTRRLFGRRSRTLRKRMRLIRRKSGLRGYGGIVR